MKNIVYYNANKVASLIMMVFEMYIICIYLPLILLQIQVTLETTIIYAYIY
jgi:hypothetical protein